MRSMIFVALALFAGVLPASAQIIGVENPFRAQSVWIKIDNFAEDGRYAFLQFGNHDLPAIPAGKAWKLEWRGPLGGWLQSSYGYVEITLAGRMCAGVEYVNAFPIPFSPQGVDYAEAGLTDEFLAGSPSRGELRARVGAAKVLLRERDVLGRKAYEKELDSFRRAIERHGLDKAYARCAGAWTAISPVRVHIYRDRYSVRQTTYVIRGGNGRYTLSGGY